MHTKPIGPHHELLTEKVAIDCEMMRFNIGQVLGRVPVINYKGETIFDTFVCYPEPIIITNTEEKYSGINWDDIDPQNGAQPFLEVQNHLIELLRNRIVISHDIQKDLKTISMALPSHILRLQGVVLLLKPVSFDNRMISPHVTRYSGLFASSATLSAVSVLPVPGGP